MRMQKLGTKNVNHSETARTTALYYFSGQKKMDLLFFWIDGSGWMELTDWAGWLGWCILYAKKMRKEFVALTVEFMMSNNLQMSYYCAVLIFHLLWWILKFMFLEWPAFSQYLNLLNCWNFLQLIVSQKGDIHYLLWINLNYGDREVVGA